MAWQEGPGAMPGPSYCTEWCKNVDAIMEATYFAALREEARTVGPDDAPKSRRRAHRAEPASASAVSCVGANLRTGM